MSRLTTLLLIFLFSFSVYAESGKINISGKVLNHSVTTIVITHLNNQKLVSAELDSNGVFHISAKIEDGYYSLKYGNSSTFIYLYPKDELNINFDANQFESTLVFKGNGSERNNYLAEKTEQASELTKDLEAFYKVDEATYLNNINNVKNTHITLLSNYEVENFFKKAEMRSLEYQRLLSIQNYEHSYKFYLGEEITPSAGFYKSVKAIELNNEEDYKKQPYYRYLVNSVWSKRIDSAPDVNGMLQVLRKVPFQDLAISLVNGFYSKISSSNDRSKDYLDLIKRVTSYEPFIEAAEKKYLEVLKSKGLTNGDIAPTFKYESVDGKTISLGDLKGNYVYIDVWATWCAPCIKQIPYLKKLEKRYANRNILFVSISVDKEDVKETWKKMVADKKLGGIQLFADNSFNSAFMDAFAVNSIPRFILIDPQGKIVNTQAPRPSFEKTIALLDDLLN